MELHKATLNDIEDLIRLRIDFIKSDGISLSNREEVAIRLQLERFFKKHIQLGDFVGIMMKENEKIVSAAFLIIHERPANLSFMSGLAGTLLNVITYPEYRRNGYATLVLNKIIEEAKNKRVAFIDLISTNEGFDLYRKLEFKETAYAAMRLKIN